MKTLHSSVDRWRRQLRRLVILRGGGSALVAMLAVILGAAVVDTLLHVDSAAVRMATSGAAVGVGIWLVVRRLVQPLSGAWDDVTIALLIERLVPAARDQLASGVQFETAAGVGDLRFGNLRLRTSAIQRAETVLEQIPFVSLTAAKDVHRIGGALLGLCLIAGTWYALAPAQARLAWQRQIAPFSDLKWPTGVGVAAVDPERTHESPRHESPRIVRFDIRVESPAYDGSPTLTETRGVGHVDALVGSRVVVKGVSNVPLSRGVLHHAHQSPVELPLSESKDEVTAVMLIETEGTSEYWFELVDQHGRHSVDMPRYELRGRPDHPPSIRWLATESSREVTPSARIPIAAECRDDVGLREIVLLMDSPTQGHQPEEQSLWIAGERREDPASDSPGPSRQQLALSVSWELERHAFTPGTIVEYRLIARDNHQPDPQSTTTSVRRLTVVSNDTKQQQIRDQQRAIAAELSRLEARQTALADMLQPMEPNGVSPVDLRHHLEQVERERRLLTAGLFHPNSGLKTRLQQILRELEINRLTDESTRRRTARLLHRIQQLAERDLPNLVQQVTIASRLWDQDEQNPRDSVDVNEWLAPLHSQQQAIAAALRAMRLDLEDGLQQVDLLSSWQGLLSEQREAHEQTVAVGKQTIGRSFEELTTPQQNALKEIGRRQQVIAEGLQQRHETRTGEQAGEAVGHLHANRIGAAVENQQAVLTALEMLTGNLRSSLMSSDVDDDGSVPSPQGQQALLELGEWRQRQGEVFHQTQALEAARKRDTRRSRQALRSLLDLAERQQELRSEFELGVSRQMSADLPTADAFRKIVEALKQAEQGLAERDTGDRVTMAQHAVLQGVDDLLASLTETNGSEIAAGDGGAGQAGSSSPLTEAGRSLGATGRPGKETPTGRHDGMRTGEIDSADRDGDFSPEGAEFGNVTGSSQKTRPANVVVWDRLPERVRKEMSKSYRENSLPEYERLLERYYERLAEESSDHDLTTPSRLP